MNQTEPSTSVPLNSLKAKWANGDETLGLWLSGPDPLTAEIVGGFDADYINIDMQHGAIDYPDTLAILASTRTSAATMTVRVPWNEPGIIGKVLDAGALGVIIPMVNTAEQAHRAVAACRYAPEGSRSHGPLRAVVAHGGDYQRLANTAVACIPMIETVEAISNLDEILAVPGIDAVYVGPADLSLTLGLAPKGEHDDAIFNDALTAIVKACQNRGIVPGIHANPAIVEKRREQGFKMITVISELLAMQAGISSALALARGEVDSVDTKAMY